MNRTTYYGYIDEKLHLLARRITTGGKLNMLNLHMHSESFYLHFFNLLYSFDLSNLNSTLQNVEAIDLIDYTNKFIIQVSATCNKAKIEDALSKDIIKQYSTFTFKFISIARDGKYQRANLFKNPHNVKFTPQSDIYDIKSILDDIKAENIDKQKEIYQFIKKELGGDVDVVKLDSNLATVINILSKEKWNQSNQANTINSFEIDRKITHNQLNKSKYIIEDYIAYHHKVDSKYSEFDSMGSNKSTSVLAKIRREYIQLKDTLNPDDLFFKITKNIAEIVTRSANFTEIPFDELELCVDILVVDAFIRCKIFENPKNYKL